MDAVQHYQPLSHALHPPVGASTSTSPDPHYNTFGGHPQLGNGGTAAPNPAAGAPHAEEEEEDEDEDIADGDDAHRHHGSNGSSPHNSGIAQSAGAANDASKSSTTEEPQIIQHQFVDGSVPQKRKPGRPKGSKTKKPRPGEATSTLQGMSASAAPSSKYPGFYQSPPHITAPQTMHPEVNAHNQQYYEFQWRILNLCSEFYNAAEELMRATSPLVIAQCYGMGPGVTIDPLHMVNEAKTICDALLANPTQLVSRPPPPMIHSLPAWSTQPYPVAQTQNGTNPPAPGATYPAGYGVPPAQGRYPTAYYSAPPPHPPTHPAPVPTGYYPYAPPPHPAQMAGGVPTHPQQQQQQQQQPGQPAAGQQGQSVSAAGPAGGTRVS